MTVIEEDAGRGIAARVIEDLMVGVVGEVSGKVMAKMIAGLYFRNEKAVHLKEPPHPRFEAHCRRLVSSIKVHIIIDALLVPAPILILCI